jgi:hypothetical protein
MQRKKWGTTKYGWSKAPGLKFTTTQHLFVQNCLNMKLSLQGVRLPYHEVKWPEMVETRAFSQEGENLDSGLVLPVPFAQVWSHQPTNWIKTLIFLLNFQWQRLLKIQYLLHLTCRNYEITSIKSYSLNNFQKYCEKSLKFRINFNDKNHSKYNISCNLGLKFTKSPP